MRPLRGAGLHGPLLVGPMLLAPTEAIPSCEVRDRPDGPVVALDCARCWAAVPVPPLRGPEAAVDALGLED